MIIWTTHKPRPRPQVFRGARYARQAMLLIVAAFWTAVAASCWGVWR